MHEKKKTLCPSGLDYPLRLSLVYEHTIQGFTYFHSKVISWYLDQITVQCDDSFLTVCLGFTDNWQLKWWMAERSQETLPRHTAEPQGISADLLHGLVNKTPFNALKGVKWDRFLGLLCCGCFFFLFFFFNAPDLFMDPLHHGLHPNIQRIRTAASILMIKKKTSA